MRIEHHHTFHAPAAACWTMFSDPASHVAKFEAMGHHGVEVLEVEHDAGRLHIVITREVDVEGIPGFAKKFIKPRNTVVSTDTWEDNGDGTYGGRFALDTQGAPVQIEGTTHLAADGPERSTYRVTVDIEVKVPLVGGKLADFSRSIVERQLDQEVALGDAWLADHPT